MMTSPAKRIANAIVYSLLSASIICVVPIDVMARPKEDPDKYYRKPNTLHGKTVLIPIGSHIEGRINQTISSRKSRAGQRFTIEITSPVLANGTDVIIPIGSKIIGEVVEATPARKIKRKKGFAKPSGRLRTSLSMIKTPDGMTHPLIASIVGEYYSSHKGRKITPNSALGRPSLGYAGSSASFSAVHPSVSKRNYGKRGPQVVSKRDYWRDPVLGIDRGTQNSTAAAYKRGTPVIRSMIKKKRDVYIYAGSPLNIRIDAPLKLSVAPSKGRLSVDIGLGSSPMMRQDSSGNYRRFQPIDNSPAAASKRKTVEEAINLNQPGQPQISTGKRAQNKQFQKPMLRQPVDPEAHLPRFLRTPKNARFLKPAPFSVQNRARPQQTSQQTPQRASQQELKPVKFSPSGTRENQQKPQDDF